MKKRKVQGESDDEDNKKEEQGFGKDLKQAQYERSPMKIPRIMNILF